MKKKLLFIGLIVLIAAVIAVSYNQVVCSPVSSQLQRQAETVQYNLWLAEQNLGPQVRSAQRGSTRERIIVRAKEALADAVSAINTSESPLLTTRDTLSEEQYCIVSRYLNAVQRYLASLPDDISQIPSGSKDAALDTLAVICCTLRVDPEAASLPTLSDIYSNLQDWGVQYFIADLEQ